MIWVVQAILFNLDGFTIQLSWTFVLRALNVQLVLSWCKGTLQWQLHFLTMMGDYWLAAGAGICSWNRQVATTAQICPVGACQWRAFVWGLSLFLYYEYPLTSLCTTTDCTHHFHGELQLTHDHAFVLFTALLLIHAVTLNSLSTIFIWVPQLLGDMDYVIFIWVHRIQKSDSLFRSRGFQSLCTPLLSSKVCMSWEKLLLAPELTVVWVWPGCHSVLIRIKPKFTGYLQV
jgi:hypothetical protein